MYCDPANPRSCTEASNLEGKFTVYTVYPESNTLITDIEATGVQLKPDSLQR